MKVSIIIPIYNAEKYLSRCLDSILTIKSVDWECILIDDGSTDNSWNIVCEYTGISDRFIAKREKNSGVSSARNLGLEICSGDRILFVDPDDYLFPEADRLLLIADTDYADYDMVLFRWADVFPNGIKNTVEIPKADFNDDADWIKKLVLLKYNMNPCWSRLFKYSIIAENNLRFDTAMRIAEDSRFVAEYLQYLHTITVVGDNAMYAYCQNNNSAMRKFYKKDIFDELLAYEKRLELAAGRNIFISEQEKKEMDSLFFGDIVRYMSKCMKHYSLKQFKNIMSDVLDNKKLSEIIYGCTAISDNYKRKFVKFLIRNKMLNTYWCLVMIKQKIRNPLTLKIQLQKINK